MKYSKSLYSFSSPLMLTLFIICTGCPGGGGTATGTTTAGNSVSANGKVSMTVAANPVTVRNSTTRSVTATITNLQLDGVTWQPAIDAKVVFRITPYPGNTCGNLVVPTTVQTDANGVATVTFKASNSPITPSVDTCYVWVVAERTFTVGTDANVSDSITLKIY